MKLFYLVIFLNLYSILAFGQTIDTTSVRRDSLSFSTSNPFVINEKNYEVINPSFITGNAQAIVRSLDNPKILVDGLPINPLINTNTHYQEFLGSMHLLSYDLKGVNVNTLQDNNRIISGRYNNAIGFTTHDIKLGKSSPEFEINSSNTIAYQDFDTLGFSTIVNLNAQQSFKNFGYRVSLTNGFQDDYIPENGLQRNSGNLKFKYEPFKQVSFTGFLDYSNFQDFKRTGKNNLESNRIFTYLNTDILLAKWLSLRGKYSLNKVSDNTGRYLQYDGQFPDGEWFNYSYLKQINYKYESSYFDVVASINKEIMRRTFLNIELGYNQNRVNYFNKNAIESRHSNGAVNLQYGTSKYFSNEKVLNTSIRLKSKNISLQYLFDRTNYTLSFFQKKENFNNHLFSLTYDLINNNDKKINNLSFQVNYGKLINHSVIGALNERDWLTKLANDNFQFNLNSSIFKNTIYFNFALYHKDYKQYNQLLYLYVGTGNGFKWVFLKEDIGRVTKSGYDMDGKINFVNGGKLKWTTEISYSNNATKLIANDDLDIMGIADTSINNKMLVLRNNLSYKNLHFSIAFEGKQGYDVDLYLQEISVSKPFSYLQSKQIIGVNNEGIPTLQKIENYSSFITDVDYFILKHVALDYQFKDARNNKYLIGLQYNKMRRLYPYVNSIFYYQEQFQRPSFFSSLSLSLKMSF